MFNVEAVVPRIKAVSGLRGGGGASATTVPGKRIERSAQRDSRERAALQRNRAQRAAAGSNNSDTEEGRGAHDHHDHHDPLRTRTYDRNAASRRDIIDR